MRKTSLLLVVMFAFGAFPAFAQKKPHATRQAPRSEAEQQQQLEEDKEAIEKLHDDDIKASLALDVPALEALWTDDIVIMPPGSKAVVGREANAARLEASVAKLKEVEVMAFDEQWQEIRIQGDWAYEYGTMSGRMKPFSGGAEISYQLNVMRVLSRQPDGSWRIARSIYNDATEAPAPKAPEKKEEPKGNPLKD